MTFMVLPPVLTIDVVTGLAWDGTELCSTA